MINTQIKIAVTPEFKEKFKKHCKNKGKDMSKVLEKLIENYLNGNNEKELSWRREAMKELPTETIIYNDEEIEVLKLSNGQYIKQRDKNSDKIIIIEGVN